MEEERRRGRLTVYLGAAPGRRQDLRDARRGAPASLRPRAPTSWSGTSRPTVAPRPWPRWRAWRSSPRQEIAYRGTTFTEMDTDAILARQARRRAGRRARAHQRARQPAREARRRTSRTSGPRASTSSRPSTSSTWSRSTTRWSGSPGCGSARPCRTTWCAPPTRSSWSTCPRRRCAAGWRTATSTGAEQIDASLSSYFRVGNLTALRELALLWLADRVDDALDDYRRAHRIDAALADQGAHRRRRHRRRRERDPAAARRPARATGRRRRAAGGARDRDRRAAQRRRRPHRPVPAAGRGARRLVPLRGRRGRPGGGGRLRHRRQRHHDRRRRLPAQPAAAALHRQHRRPDRLARRVDRRPPGHPRAGRGTGRTPVAAPLPAEPRADSCSAGWGRARAAGRC